MEKDELEILNKIAVDQAIELFRPELEEIMKAFQLLFSPKKDL